MLVAAPLGGSSIGVRTSAGVREYPTPCAEFTHADLLAAVEAGALDGLAGQEAMQVNRVIEAAYRSSRERRTVADEEL